MTSEERRQFARRAAWLIIPGLISGLVTGSVAYGTISTRLDYMEQDIDRIEEKANTNTDTINFHRIERH